MIAIAVGDIEFVGLRIDAHVGGAVHIGRILIALALVAAANLQNEFTVLGEFQQRVVGDLFESGMP